MVVVYTEGAIFIGKEENRKDGEIELLEPVMARVVNNAGGIAIELMPVLPKPKEDKINIKYTIIYELGDFVVKDEYERAVAQIYKGIKIGNIMNFKGGNNGNM